MNVEYITRNFRERFKTFLRIFKTKYDVITVAQC